MKRRFSATPLPRYQVFTLADGNYVVQWDDKRVQELLTGNYREYEHRRDFGHPVNDYELKQLKAAGRVEHYNRDYVWLYALPETGRFGVRKEMGRGERIRAYYLSTSLPKSQQDQVVLILNKIGAGHHLYVTPRQNLLIIMNKDGSYFKDSDEAEQIQNVLQSRVPDLFSDITIAYDEVNARAPLVGTSSDETNYPLSFDDLIASQRDTSMTTGRRILMMIPNQEENEAFIQLLTSMEITIHQAVKTYEALETLEDHPIDLLLMDIQLSDLHGWQMISKVKEIESLRDLPILIIGDEIDLSKTVAKVDYLTRPVSIARLRHNIWRLLRERTKILRPPHH